MPLSGEPLQRAQEQINLIRSSAGNPETPLVCPQCSAATLTIIDASARPHAEWYVLTCSSCGLDEKIYIPLGAPPPVPE